MVPGRIISLPFAACKVLLVPPPPPPSSPSYEITLIYFAGHLAKTICYNTIKPYQFAVQVLYGQHNFPPNYQKVFRLQKVLTGMKQSQRPPKLSSNFEFNAQ